MFKSKASSGSVYGNFKKHESEMSVHSSSVQMCSMEELLVPHGNNSQLNIQEAASEESQSRRGSEMSLSDGKNCITARQMRAMDKLSLY